MMEDSPKDWFPKLLAPDEQDCKAARRYFCSLTPEDRAAVPELIEALESGDRVFGYWAARALSGVGPEATDAIPALIKAVSHDSSDIRFWAVVALSSIGPDAKPAVPALIDRFGDSVFGVRQAIADALVRIEPASVAVMFALVNRLKTDDSEWVRQSIVQALSHSGRKEAVLPLAEALADQDDGVRRYAVIALKVLGPTAKQAHPALKAFLATCEAGTELRIQAEAALRATGSES